VEEEGGHLEGGWLDLSIHQRTGECKLPAAVPPKKQLKLINK